MSNRSKFGVTEPSKDYSYPTMKSSRNARQNVTRRSRRSSFNCGPTIVIPKTPKSARRVSNGPRSLDHSKGIEKPSTIVPPDNELATLIEKCYLYLDYSMIVIKGSDLPVHPPEREVILKGETLSHLLFILSDDLFKKVLSRAELVDLFEMIRVHIFRPIPAFTPPDEFSEISQNYIIKHWEHIECVYKILTIIMADQLSFCPLLTDSFADDLVRQLGSPVIQEQKQVEAILKTLLESYIGYRKHVLKSMMNKLNLYFDGANWLSVCVGPILRLYLTYFKVLPQPIKRHNIDTFRNIFYPLIRTHLANTFEGPLREMTRYFQSQDPTILVWCITYLKKHWPMTSSRKESLFFDQLTHLVAELPDSAIQELSPSILSLIARCIVSDNWQVSMNACLFCSDANSIIMYDPKDLKKYILPAVKTAAQHWKIEERDIAECMLADLNKMVVGSAGRAPRRSAMSWQLIKDMAKQAD